MKERVIEQTSSICPKCKQHVEAVIVENNKAAYMKKHCDKHGAFKVLISKYAWYYEGLNQFYNKIATNKYCFGAGRVSDYQLFPRINSNLEYDIFFSNGIDETVDLSLEEIKNNIKNISLPGKIVMLGGEPTARPDLPDIINIIASRGHRPWLYSNGYRLDDIAYLRKIKKAGLRFIFLWVDALSEDIVYEKIRGRKFLSEKKKILNNLKEIKLPTGVIMTVVKGVNEQQIQDIIDFTALNQFIYATVIKACSYVGRKKFLQQAELPIDELVELVSRQTGLISVEEFYIFQKLLYALFCFTRKPLCYLKQFIYLPRQKNIKLSAIIDFKQLELHLGRFSDMYQENRLKAKAYFLKEILKKCAKHHLFFFLLGWQKFSWCRKHFLRLDFSGYYTEFNYDEKKVKTRCNDIWLPSLAKDEPIDFCRILINSFKL
jgi:uncharacterized radical SAM superfamily Fe-S cluster-containing enzyme